MPIKLPSALELLLFNAAQFFVIVANTRAYTQGNYLWTAITDLVFCVIGFELTKRIAESKSKYDKIGYVLGGLVGAQVAIFVTKLLYGQ